VASDRLEVLYFAYGSNLCLFRMRARALSAGIIGAATLSGYTLRWSKRGVDGSGKCTIAVSPREANAVHGVLYRLSATDKAELDVVEGLGTGYDEAWVTVETPAGRREATTYVAAPSHVDDTLAPYTWYRDLVVAGAVEAGMPDDYVRRLATAGTQQDPDTNREARNRAAIPCGRSPDRALI
jgi:gamma-glutamylcyclotransferase